ncbi:hypothetical protein EDB80DRAFT_872746 [Ilyonectria destructans]|nr:hypothetical protein EDB80DRAFT_872746 [Ilyonectria destructans]
MSSTPTLTMLLLSLVLPVALRWLLHVPSGFVMGAGHYYGLLRDMKDVYDVVPGADNLIQGQLLVGTAGTVLLFWNFANFALCACASYLGAFQIIIGLVDLAITVAIITGLAMQASLLPNTYGGCNAMAEDSKFFQAASEALFGTQTPQAICRDMVWSDKFATAVVCLYSIVTFVDLLKGIVAIIKAIEPHWPRLLATIGHERLVERGSAYWQATRRHAVHCYVVTVRTCGRVKENLAFTILPSNWAAAIRDPRRRRAAADDESLAEMAVKDEEELGLMSRPYEEEGSKEVDEERVGLMAQAEDQDDHGPDSPRRWSEDTVTGGRTDTRA